MLKKSKFSRPLPLCLAALAAIAIIIACGDGKIVRIDPDDIVFSLDPLKDFIDGVKDDPGPSSPSGGDSSPSGGDSSPSGGNSSPSGGNSSPSGGGSSDSGGDSSPSGGGSSDSGNNSSNSNNSSSSAAPPPAISCLAGSTSVTGATCTWNKPTVVSGDPAQVSTSPTTEGCDSKVFATVEDDYGKTGIAYFEKGTDIITAGEVSTDKSVKFNWPLSGSAGIKSKITCGENACSVVDCPLTINKAPDPTVTPSKSVKFDNRDYSSSSKLYYFKGSKPKITSTATKISNNADAKCTKIKLEITAGTTYNQSSEAVIPEDGTISLTTYTAGDGLPAVNAETEITAKVIATCRGSEHVLATATATLVPDPTLTTCAWTPEASKFYKGQQADAKATLSNSYGRCGADGEKHVTDFPRELIATDVGKNLNGTINITCSAGYGPLQAVCPASPTVGDGKIGGGVDTPFEPGNGGGNLPNTSELTELGGVLYLHGYGANNQNALRCNNTNNSNSYTVHYCDYWTGDCEPTTVCATNTNQISCNLNIVFHNTATYTGNCGHGGALCEYKVKLKFTGNGYPGNCKIGN